MDFGSQNPSLIWSVIFIIIISLLGGAIKEIKMKKRKALKNTNVEVASLKDNTDTF